MRVLATFLFLLICVAPLSAREPERCLPESPAFTKQVRSYVVRIYSYRNEKEDAAGCRAIVRDANKRVVFAVSEYSLSITEVEHGVDKNGQVPYLVLEGYSGGMHCCWTYYIISLRGKGGLVKKFGSGLLKVAHYQKFENERGSAFRYYSVNDRLEINTMDGAFDYFDDLSHAETPFPEVYLRLAGNRLIDVGTAHQREYDKIIAEAKQKLTPSALASFKAAPNRQALLMIDENRHTLPVALTIVFAYLYSGRKAQAHDALAQMWPAFDRQRIWSCILKTRREGVLKYVKPSPSAGSARIRLHNQARSAAATRRETLDRV